MALARRPLQELSAFFESGEKGADFPESCPEPLPIELPHMFLEKIGPMRTEALDQLRRLLHEYPDSDHRGPPHFSHGPLYPRKLLFVDYAGTLDDIEYER